MKKIASFLFALVLAASPSALAGEEAEVPLSVAPMFGHNAVLQRDVPLPIWGTAAPGAKVSVRVQRPDGAGEGKTVADAEGRWRTTLPAQRVTAPSEEPAKIVIEAVSGASSSRTKRGTPPSGRGRSLARRWRFPCPTTAGPCASATPGTTSRTAISSTARACPAAPSNSVWNNFPLDTKSKFL